MAPITSPSLSSADLARACMEQWIPVEAERRAILLALARSCVEAHQQTPQSWGVILSVQKKFARLNVGMANVLVISADQHHTIMVGRRGAPSDSSSVTQEFEYRPAQNVTSITASSSDFGATYERVFTAHRAAIAEAGGRKGGYLWQGHSPGLLAYVRAWLPVTVPDPDNPKAAFRSAESHPDGETLDDELAAFEGEARTQFALHRSHERHLHGTKIKEALKLSRGRLACEVPGCGFDFQTVYGSTGAGYAQVHHRQPLSSLSAATPASLDDLVVVCANCHAMIHHGGECRSVDELVQREPQTHG